MADPRKRLPTNESGDFFVDSTCINCDTCRQLSPGIFGQADGYSMVSRQPKSEAERESALQALVCCPTGSIGTESANSARDIMKTFPLRIDGAVFYCGFNSPKSYGGNSYFIQYAGGNWLVDSPKFLPQLVRQFEELGGIEYVFLTHRDDVADADKYARHFNARRIIHRDDAAAQPDAEIILEGTQPQLFAGQFKIIPTPGHTAGHCVLLHEDKYLFTGDHLAWERDAKQLEAWPDYAWYSWDEQKDSIRLLQQYEFEWILPGHGQRVNLSRTEMQLKLDELIASLS